MPPDSSQRIGKGEFGFGIPGDLPCWQVIRLQSMGHEGSISKTESSFRNLHDLFNKQT